MRRYQRLIYTVPRRAGLSEDDAADIFQICFQRLLEHIDRLEDGTRVRAWLVTTAKRESLRRIEAARRFAQPSPRRRATTRPTKTRWTRSPIRLRCRTNSCPTCRT